MTDIVSLVCGILLGIFALVQIVRNKKYFWLLAFPIIGLVLLIRMPVADQLGSPAMYLIGGVISTLAILFFYFFLKDDKKQQKNM